MDEVNDINGDFSIVPDDHPDTNNDFTNKILDTKNKIIDKLATAQKSFGYFKYALIVVCLTLSSLLIARLVKISKKLLKSRNSRKRYNGLEAPIGNYSIIELTERFRDKS